MPKTLKCSLDNQYPLGRTLIYAIIRKMTERERVGKLGENLAVDFLERCGYQIVERNFKKLPWGEIDIIAKKSPYLYFFEVKTVSKSDSFYLPENKINRHKKRALLRTIQVYLNKSHLALDSLWQIDAIIIKIDFLKRKYALEHLENIFYG